MKRVTLDIGGKLFHTTTSTIERRPETTLSMLLSHHLDESVPLFIDRDPGNFRWILHWYRTGILVDHTTVGVPPEVWDDEIAFYCISVGEADVGLGEQAPERKRAREKDDEFARKCKERHKELEKKKDEQVELRRVEYQKVLNLLISRMNAEGITGYGFVESDERKLDHYPPMYPTINISWLEPNMNEFVKFCKEYGFNVKRTTYNSGYMGHHRDHFWPAKMVNFKRKHHYMELTIERAT
jgi:hypothetical protein